ncbi:MAG: hypothetical protein NTW54_13810 [Bacteroidetes bacterium]|nr:hypothetical protein [Bacteroidota bacterium]
MRKLLSLCLFLLFCIFSPAQKLKLWADEKIMQKLENQKLMNNPDSKHNGSRYQIFQGSSRSAAYAVNGNFVNLFPDMPTYVLYEPPNFKVRVGDFRFKFEAIAFKQQMLDNGLTGFFIVHDKINVPKPK